MKYYAEVQSERNSSDGAKITKGHGGNEWIRVDFRNKDKERIATAILNIIDGELILEASTWNGNNMIERAELSTKGKKQKTAKDHKHKWSKPIAHGYNEELIQWCEGCTASKDSDGGIIE